MTLPGPDVPVIDETRLINEFGGDQEILDELRDLFLEHAPPLYTAMAQAIREGDCESLARDAHSFKGACATYGAARLAMVCKEFELAAKAGVVAGIQPGGSTTKQIPENGSEGPPWAPRLHFPVESYRIIPSSCPRNFPPHRDPSPSSGRSVRSPSPANFGAPTFFRIRRQNMW